LRVTSDSRSDEQRCLLYDCCLVAVFEKQSESFGLKQLCLT